MEEIKCLDHGFVRLVDKLGTDKSIVDAARNSYKKGTKTYREDQRLINYLWRMHHGSPFEFCEYVFHLKLPIFVMRQLIRYRTASTSEMSGRYSEFTNEFYLPEFDQICYQSKNNKQGRDTNILEDAEEVIGDFQLINKTCYNVYENSLERGLAKELARTTLPVSYYTEAYWKIDLRNLLHVIQERTHPHAQYEIRVYGEAFADFVKKYNPMVWNAFEEYTLHSKTFSRKEMQVIDHLIDAGLSSLGGYLDDFMENFSKTEKSEFLDKINGVIPK